MWALQMVQALDLHGLGYSGAGVAVCIVDTGIDLTHPDLSGARVVGWHDFVNRRPAPYDDDGHGTAMAGIIAGNGPRFKGAAPGASLLVAKALDARGQANATQVAAAIRFCLDPNGDSNPADGAAIISLSLSSARSPILGSELDQAVMDAIAQGVFVVAAAGNDGGPADDGDVQSPSSIALAISVGAVDESRLIAPFSSVGNNALRFNPNKKPEVVAPGERVVSDARGGGYQLVSGTSPAAALVSGLLALVLEGKPSYAKTGRPTAISNLKLVLMRTSAPAPGQRTPHDDHYGYGVVAALALLRGL